MGDELDEVHPPRASNYVGKPVNSNYSLMEEFMQFGPGYFTLGVAQKVKVSMRDALEYIGELHECSSRQQTETRSAAPDLGHSSKSY